MFDTSVLFTLIGAFVSTNEYETGAVTTTIRNDGRRVDSSLQESLA